MHSSILLTPYITRRRTHVKKCPLNVIFEILILKGEPALLESVKTILVTGKIYNVMNYKQQLKKKYIKTSIILSRNLLADLPFVSTKQVRNREPLLFTMSYKYNQINKHKA